MIIDLSVPLDNQTPAYPGDPKIELTQEGSVAADGYMGHQLRLGSHTGTHIDAPAHMIEGADTLGAIDLSTFIGKAKLLTELSVGAAKAAQVSAGDIVICYTGASQRFYKPSYFTDYPVLPDELADYLIAQGVKLVGLDTCSADIVDGFPIHRKLLGAGIPIVENLTNLTALQDLSVSSFEIYALPLKLDIDGAPARVVAIVNQSADQATVSIGSHHA